MYTFEIHKGKKVQKFVKLIADYRISFFKQYPYLYEGNMSYEDIYLQGIIKEKDTLLIVVLFNNTPIAISTSYPLTAEADILTDTYVKFKNENKNPEDFYYYSEVIITDNHRLKGLSKKIYTIQENYAKELGFKKICLATVLREENDIRKPDNYKQTDGLWINLGFTKTDIVIEHEWPTIQADSTVKVIKNRMLFWEKNV